MMAWTMLLVYLTVAGMIAVIVVYTKWKNRFW